ncbi:MAG: S-layer y protein [Paenibacillaceae bacterium]|jgi:hypothetical protein|nr:S-layer y protein [Paenibacillaceae bacterium]
MKNRLKAVGSIPVLLVFMLLAVLAFPLQADAEAEIRSLDLYRMQEQVPYPSVNYFIMGRPTSFDLVDTAAVSTSVELKVEYSTDGGVNWQHLKDYGVHEYDVIVLPNDYNMTSIHLRFSAKFDPVIGADSRDTKVFGPYKVYHAYGPTQAAYTAGDDGKVRVTFQDNSTMEDRYQIIRYGDGQEKRFTVESSMASRGTVTFTDSTVNSLKSTKYLYQIEPVFDSIPLPLDLQPSGTSVLAETTPSLLGHLKLSSVADTLKSPAKFSDRLKDVAVQEEEETGGFKIIIPFEFKLPSGNGGGTGGQGGQEQQEAAAEQEAEEAAVEQEIAELEQLLNITASQASGWAREDIKSATLLGLTTGDVLADYQKPISRQHFAGIVVKLMEKLTGTPGEVPPDNPFRDTDDPEILKAYQFSVIQGKSTDTFDPYSDVSRQEISVMLWRIFHLTGLYGQLPAGAAIAFADREQTDSWAADAVDYISSIGMLQGKGEGRFDPLGSTTREEAIVLIKRAYDAAAAVE